MQRNFFASLSLLTLVLAGSSCGGLASLGIKHKGGLDQVDELLSRVERVQIESAVSKQRAKEALENLRTMIAPEFRGEPAAAHRALETAVDESIDQAGALESSVRPLKSRGQKIFRQWTENLESFGNIAMRQRSQQRLEDTRRHHDVIIAACLSAQLAYDGFNGDLSDHVLFLEHDFNAASIGVIAQELDGLKSRAKELARRLDAVAAACEAYVKFSAPRSQLSPVAAPKARKNAAARGN